MIYYKLLNPDLKHYHFIYREGLNELAEPFNADPESEPGGLYYSDQDNIFKWIELYRYDPDLLIARVTLPEDAHSICIDSGYGIKYKSDKIILSNIQRLDNMISSDLCMTLNAVKQNGMILQYVKNQTYDICMEAVKQTGLALQYVKNQTEENCMEAIKQNIWALEYVNNQTEDMCMKAVKKDGLVLQFVKNQTEAICMKAVKQNSMAFKYVKIETDMLWAWKKLNRL
jgi:hypothetical protein